MLKFNRNYVLKVQTNDKIINQNYYRGVIDSKVIVYDKIEYEFLEITYPITIDFNIQQNIQASAKTGSFIIYNLKESTREKIYKDQYRTDQIKLVEFSVGYGTELFTVFKGNIKHAYSYREGTEFITEIEAYDGGFDFPMSYSNMTVPAGTPAKLIIEKLVGDMPLATLGKVGDFSNSSPRGRVLSGNTAELLSEVTNNHWFIHNGKINALHDNEVIKSEITEISSDYGLIGSPRLSDTLITLKMLLEPRFVPGQIINLNSTTANKILNGQRCILGINHIGTISGATDNDCYSEINLQFIDAGFTIIS